MGTALLIARLGLGLTFAVAAGAKLADLAGVRATLRSFGVPERSLVGAAIALALTEAVVAALLIATPTASAGALAAAGLLALFSLGAAVALRRGERPECNCFGQVSSKPVGRHTFVRNAILAAIATTVALGGGGDGFAETFGGASAAQLVAGSGIVALITVLGVQAWFSWHLFRQNGRLVARVSVLERNLADQSATARQPALELGEPVPGFELPDLDGEPRSLDELLAPGEPIALVFSDPACAACGPLLVRLDELGEERRHPIELVLISRGDPADERTRLNGHTPATVLLQEAHEVADLCGVAAVPTALVVDAGGRVASEAVSGQEAIEELITSWWQPANELVVNAGGGR